MALFSRRSKDAEPPTPPAEPVADQSVQDAAATAVADTSSAASVGISMSSFRGLGATTTPAQTPAAPARRSPDETFPGLKDNVLLRDSLARYPEQPQPSDLLDLARQLLQGHLFLRVKGDAQALISEGKPLPLASITIGEQRFAVAFSSGKALADSIRADGDAGTSAMGQPVLLVLRNVLASDAAGLAIDPSSAPARAILPRELIERMLSALDEDLALKTLLAGARTDATASAVVDAMTRAPLWVAVNRPAEGEGRIGVAEGRAPDGSRYLEVYSHPLEVVAMGRGDTAAPLSGARIAGALRADDGLAGIVVDPRGPWIRLSRDDLAPLLALSDS
ncbi:MAG: SseB family protein [Microbacterium sp.]